MIKHSPRLEILATNRLDEPVDASPAIVIGRCSCVGRSTFTVSRGMKKAAAFSGQARGQACSHRELVKVTLRWNH